MQKDRRQDRSLQTAAAIKELIIARNLHPGDPMPTEAELVESLGVSRSNLREAVRTLVALDILEVRHGTGTFVGQLTLRPLVEGMVFRSLLMPGEDLTMLREVVEVRRGLDQSLAPQIIEHLTGRPDPALRRCVDQILALSKAGKTFPTPDRQFHLLLAQQLGNALYGQLVAAFWDIHQTMAPRLGVPTPRDLADTAAAHANVLDAALAGDLPRYLQAVDDHYAPLLRTIATRQPPHPRGRSKELQE